MLKSSPIGDVIIELMEIDSTNNYAMRLINEGMAEHGLVITALFQHAGKGQHGHQWVSNESNNLLFSIILDTTAFPIEEQFALNTMTAVTIAEIMAHKYMVPDISIKWPNDIYSGKKKISGILIENHLRGNTWVNAVVGIGINVNQSHFPDLPNATSIYNETGVNYQLKDILTTFLQKYGHNFYLFHNKAGDFLDNYNHMLYGSGKQLSFHHHEQQMEGRLKGVNSHGQIELEIQGQTQRYQHREIKINFT